jgi:3-oxoadipate enol-lactonase
VAERIEIGGVTFAYEDTGGDGPAVVLIHGLGGSLLGWRAQLRALAEAGYRAIAYDGRGAGLTREGGEVPRGPFSVEDWAEDAVAMVDALGVERAALVGHSMGCMVAQRAAVALGERCWALALCGGRAEWPEQAGETFEQRATMARSGRLDEVAEAVAGGGLSDRCRAERPELWGLLVAAITAHDPAAYAESALATGRGSMCGLDGLTCPVLAFAGSEDAVTPPEAAAEIAAAVPRGESTVIEGAAHWCMLEAPAAVNDALARFLGRA